MRMPIFHLAVAAIITAMPSASFSQTIHVSSAVYGTPAVSTCNATAAIAAQCDGRRHCVVDIRNTRLCGDPDFLEVKQIGITYLCGVRKYTTSASEYAKSTLACR